MKCSDIISMIRKVNAKKDTHVVVMHPVTLNLFDEPHPAYFSSNPEKSILTVEGIPIKFDHECPLEQVHVMTFVDWEMKHGHP